MTLPGETIATGAPAKCDAAICENAGPQVLMSAAGYYIGYSCRLCGPYSRESEAAPTASPSIITN